MFRDTILVPVGGENKAMVAFRASDGKRLWLRQTADNGMSSPLIVEFHGKPQVIAVMLDRVISVDPANGDLLWTHPHKNNTNTNVSTPVLAGNDTLLISSAYNSGTRALKLIWKDGKPDVTELWYNGRIRVHVGNILVRGDAAYASSGDFGPAPMTAFKVSTGEILWQDRRLAKSAIVELGSQVLTLDEKGKLVLASFTARGVEVHAEAQLLADPSWTPPIVVGHRTFLRDRKTMLAVELPAQ